MQKKEKSTRDVQVIDVRSQSVSTLGILLGYQASEVSMDTSMDSPTHLAEMLCFATSQKIHLGDHGMMSCENGLTVSSLSQ